jgi:hypothetical protein
MVSRRNRVVGMPAPYLKADRATLARIIGVDECGEKFEKAVAKVVQKTAT